MECLTVLILYIVFVYLFCSQSEVAFVTSLGEAVSLRGVSDEAVFFGLVEPLERVSFSQSQKPFVI